MNGFARNADHRTDYTAPFVPVNTKQMIYRKRLQQV
jgi:hypothetical protein